MERIREIDNGAESFETPSAEDAQPRMDHEKEAVKQNEELRRAYVDLDAARAQYLDLYNSAPVGYWTINEQGLIQETNISAVNMLDVARGAMINQPVTGYILKDDLEVYFSNHKRLIETRTPQECELRLVKGSGSQFWAHLKLTIAKGADDALVIWLAFNDISSCKLLEQMHETDMEKLRASYAFNMSVLDSLTEQIAVLDRQGRIIAVNKAWEQFGESNSPEHKFKNSIGMNYLSVCDAATGRPLGEEAPAVASGIREILDGKKSKFNIDYPCHSPENIERWFNVSGTKMQGTSAGAVIRHENITHRKNAEMALRIAMDNAQNSHVRLFSIINSAMDGIITIDEDNKIVVFNSSAEKMFLCSAKDAIGTSIDRFLPERFRPEHRNRVSQFMKSGTSNRTIGHFGAICGLRANGEEFPIEASISQVVLNSKHLMTVTLRDSTERLLAEKKKRELELQLRQAQKLEAIGTLAGGIAHDFNNILGIIVGNAELLETELIEKSQARLHLSRILKASERATALIQQILTFSRQQKEPLREKIVLDAAINEALILLRASIPASVEIDCSFNSKESCVLGDSTQVHQVFMNLVNNAWQAMPGRIGKIRIKTSLESHSKSLVVGDSYLPVGDYIHCVVIDDGKGIAEEDIHRIFDPFFTTKAPGEGSGLGLAVVHGIIRGNGGAISVSSTPGLGTEFHLFFPVYHGVEDQSKSSGELSSDRGNGQHIVVVDDEPDLIDVTGEMLSEMGYRVSSFVDPRGALEFICMPENSCDLVISDMTMPNMSGIELVKAIRKQNTTIPVLLVTGFADVIPEEHLRQGTVEILKKPLKRNVLREAISHFFSRVRRS